MTTSLPRAYIVELLGTFGFVFFAAGVVCVNALATPLDQPLGTSPVNLHQPGLVGIALAQGLIFAVLLSITVPVSGGYLNPAVTVMLWAFNRLDTRRMSWYVGAQVLGAVLAGLTLRFLFSGALLRSAHFGVPHMNLLAYHDLSQATKFAGIGIELVLTFFLVYAMFAAAGDRPNPERSYFAAWAGGAALAAAVLVGFSLTGAALNPARWFGPVVWEALDARSLEGRALRGAWDDALVYLAGPVLGALLAGGFCFYFYGPSRKV